MSGEFNGLQALIRQLTKKPMPIRNHAHRLNLVLIDVAKNVRSADETIGLLEAIYSFRSLSVLWQEIFSFKKKTATGNKHLHVLQQCDSRTDNQFEEYYEEAVKIANMNQTEVTGSAFRSRTQKVSSRLEDYLTMKTIVKVRSAANFADTEKQRRQRPSVLDISAFSITSARNKVNFYDAIKSVVNMCRKDMYSPLSVIHRPDSCGNHSLRTHNWTSAGAGSQYFATPFNLTQRCSGPTTTSPLSSSILFFKLP
ncbi:hypothetical protein J6590_040479 [Homalodisca vitripennis]|nr:hypothetical protein J6590_040479 [Homalodisca vitripennis]